MEIRVHEIGNYMLRNYLLETETGWIAIDTGYPGGCDKFVSSFEKLAPLAELKYIFLTHVHDDHAGFLSDLMDRCDARLVLHPAGLPVLKAGENLVKEGAGYSSRLASLFGVFKKDFRFPGFNPGKQALYIQNEEDQLFERLGLPVRIVFLPGHTADSMGLLMTETGDLFCGDAAMNAVISVARHTIWIDSKREFQLSWDKMLGLNPKRIIPAHGNPFPPRDLRKYRHYLDDRELVPMHIK
ncbi:MBL fold metallo-hydrolase [Brucepastera parasyntrophica]|uniref:MBL fold metallo-hydrolase n=1 Tax=Brucepastera parasyntrophica TaxID=2880008 RepID=UPI00210BB827|nr:MBL fold metallo-hydrolase [Brucepastera parasyntrophica]ULQ59266.1 MBL fold metallo-hydrolase [Brucepastera parasyntrophica]